VSSVRPTFKRVFADDEPRLASALEHLGAPEAIGIDVEMGQRIKRLPGGVTKGEQILALIQIAGNDVSLICDPLRIRDLSPLGPLMASDTVKVVLGGATDIQLLEDGGLPIHNVVDLAEVAISVFGHKEEGMRALADRALGVQIDKSIRRENWLRRPINPAMLSYAHRDAELTLQLYYWFRREHPEALTAHARKRFHPALSGEIAEWVRKYLTKRIDALRLLKDLRIDPVTKASQLARDIRVAQSQALSPGQQRRLLRLIGEVGLAEMYDEVLPYLDSPSAVFRATAARTLGRLGNADAKPHLEGLLNDPIPDVSAAAEVALRDLKGEKPASTREPQTEEGEPGLNPSARLALESLREQLPPSDSDEPRPKSPRLTD